MPIIQFFIRILLLLSSTTAICFTHAFCATNTNHQHNHNSMKASVYIAVTLDGYIADVEGSVSFLDEYQSSASKEDGDMGFSEFLSSVDLLVMGRKTWDQVISFGEDVWPYGERQVWIWSRQQPSEIYIPECRAHQERLPMNFQRVYVRLRMRKDTSTCILMEEQLYNNFCNMIV